MTAVLKTKLDDINVKDEFEKIAKEAEKAGLSVEKFAEHVAAAGKQKVAFGKGEGDMSFADRTRELLRQQQEHARQTLENAARSKAELKRTVVDNLANMFGGVVRDAKDLWELKDALAAAGGAAGLWAAKNALTKPTAEAAAAGVKGLSGAMHAGESAAIAGESAIMGWVGAAVQAAATAGLSIVSLVSLNTIYRSLTNTTADTSWGLERVGKDLKDTKNDVVEYIPVLRTLVKEWDNWGKTTEKNNKNTEESSEFLADFAKKLEATSGRFVKYQTEITSYWQRAAEGQKAASEASKQIAQVEKDESYLKYANALGEITAEKELVRLKNQLVSLSKAESDNTEKVAEVSGKAAAVQARIAAMKEIALDRERAAAEQLSAQREEAVEQAKSEFEKRTNSLNSYWATVQNQFQEEIKLRKQLGQDVDALQRKERQAESQRTDSDNIEKEHAARRHAERMDNLQAELDKRKTIAQEKEKADQAEKDRIAELKRLRDEAAQKELEHLQKVRGLLKDQKEVIQQNQQAGQQQAQGGQQNFGPGIAGDQSQRFGPNIADIFNPMKVFFQQQIQGQQQARGGVDRDVLRAAQRQNRAAFDQDLGGQALAGAFGKDDQLRGLFDKRRFIPKDDVARKPLDAQIKKRKKQIFAEQQRRAKAKLGQANKQARKDILGGKPPAGAVKEVADAKQDKVLGAAKKRGAVNQQQIDLLKKLQALDQAEQAELDKVQVDLTNVKAAIDALTNKQQQRVRKMR